MARSTTILPAGWQVATRCSETNADAQVYYLQRQHGNQWRDVAGPYGQRYGAVQAFYRLSSGARRVGEPGKPDRVTSDEPA